MKGKNFLKVTGILMIIFGAVALIINILALLVASAGASLLAASGAGAAGTILVIAMILVVLAAVVEIITGIVGIKNCDKPERAKTCVIFGIITLVLAIIGQALNIAGGTENSVIMIIVSIIAGIAIPVLYLIGAFLNKKAEAPTEVGSDN